jgi:hypothetical protein
MSVTKPHIVKHGSIHMNDREFSDIEIFQHSRKGIPLFMTGHKNCELQQWAAYPQFSKLNKITSVLQTSVTNQPGSIKKIFPLKLKLKAVCIRFSDPVILNTVSSQVHIAVCKCLFRNPSAVIF